MTGLGVLLARFVIEGYADVETLRADGIEVATARSAGLAMRWASELLDEGVEPTMVLALKRLGSELGVARRESMMREARARRRRIRRVA